jgi:putative effector of murein hydrolase LrgA (UPF0299 family)
MFAWRTVVASCPRIEPADGVKLSNAQRTLAVALAAYVVADILLTPPARLETRNPAFVTPVGIAALALLFIGLALSILALVLLFRGSARAPIAALVAAVLFLPAPLTEVSGDFSSLRPPAAIASIEVIQTAVALAVVGISVWLLRWQKRQSGRAEGR